MVVSVLINTAVKKLNKVYDYLVKDEDISKVELGKRVKVNFGRSKNKFEEGIIVKLQSDDYASKYTLKYIEEILDDISYIDSNKLKLAKWMSYMYFCNVYDVLKLMLPPGTNSINNDKDLKVRTENVLRLAKDIDEIESDIEEKIIKSAKQQQVLRFLNENEYVTTSDIKERLRSNKVCYRYTFKQGIHSSRKSRKSR